MGQNCVGHRFLSCEQVLVCLTPASEDVSPLLDPSLPLCPPCPPAATSPPLPCILTLLSPCCQPGPNVPNEANWNPSFSVPFDFSPCWTFQLWDSFCGRFFHLAARFCRNHTDSIAQDFKSIVSTSLDSIAWDSRYHSIKALQDIYLYRPIVSQPHRISNKFFPTCFHLQTKMWKTK